MEETGLHFCLRVGGRRRRRRRKRRKRRGGTEWGCPSLTPPPYPLYVKMKKNEKKP